MTALPHPLEDRRRTDATRRSELAAFLRSRRERLSPEQVGLATSGRRRTPGLRREEVAQLAGVGVTWYTWLEQARDISASPQVLESVSRSLQLDRHEHRHLFALAGLPVGAVEPREDAAVKPSTSTILEQLMPAPALLVSSRSDVLAYNASARVLVGDLDEIPVDERNNLWLIFTHPQWRAALAEWDIVTTRLTAQFRARMAEHVTEPAWRNLVLRLRAASPAFDELWSRQEVAAPQDCTKTITHPVLGMLRLDTTSLWVDPRRDMRVVVYTAADDRTREVLPDLAALGCRARDGSSGLAAVGT